MKDYGVDRTLDAGSAEYSARYKEAQEMMASGKYAEVVFDEDSGGIYAIEKGKAKHKPEEKEAAKYMASAGYKVILTDEGGSGVSPEGTIFNFVYEQATPQPNQPITAESARDSVNRALVHGVKKVRKAERRGGQMQLDVAVIYDKYHSYNRRNIEAGIKEFEKHGDFRYRRIIVISSSGKVYEHYHNDVGNQQWP